MALVLRHAIRPAITLAALGASAALVACGGSSEAGSGDGQADFEDAALEYAECMRGNGVEMPDPEVGAGGQIGIQITGGSDPESESFKQAEEECDPILDEGIRGAAGPDSAEHQDDLHKLAECLRDAGFDVPEPVVPAGGAEESESSPPSAGSQGSGPTSSLAGPLADWDEFRDDPEFQRAEEACHEELGLPAPALTPGPQGEEPE